MWVGARYSLTNSVDVAAAYYHVDANQFASAAIKTATGTQLSDCLITSIANTACHGTADAASFLIDWQFAPKWDTYIGVLWSEFRGGQASGFLSATPDVTNVSTTAGLRFRW
jgi:predicted porin